MRTSWRRNLLTGLITLTVLGGLFLTPFGARAQTTVLNYFAQPDSTNDNALHIGGSFYLGPTRAQTVSVVLTNAQVLALYNTPVTLVAAPGAGKFVDVIGVTVAFHYVAAYTSGSNLKLFWSSRVAGNAASSAIAVSGLLTGVSADALIRVAGTPDGTNPPSTNLPLVVEQLTPTAFGGGDPGDTVTITVEYRIVTSGL